MENTSQILREFSEPTNEFFLMPEAMKILFFKITLFAHLIWHFSTLSKSTQLWPVLQFGLHGLNLFLGISLRLFSNFLLNLFYPLHQKQNSISRYQIREAWFVRIKQHFLCGQGAGLEDRGTRVQILTVCRCPEELLKVWGQHLRHPTAPQEVSWPNLVVFTLLCTQLCLTLCDLIDCYPPASSVALLWILQARILGWVATSFSHVSCIGRWVLYH